LHVQSAKKETIHLKRIEEMTRGESRSRNIVPVVRFILSTEKPGDGEVNKVLMGRLPGIIFFDALCKASLP
jgi:hypothetical protein